MLISVSSNADIVKKISILGNKRISDNTIIDIIDLNKSKDYSESDFNNFQKKLFETNFFSKVNVVFKNGILEIDLIENPLVEFFTIQGVSNETIEDLIYETISLGQNKIFSEFVLNQDLQKIKSIYNDLGYLNASVDTALSEQSNGNLNIVIKINKGNKVKLKRVFFIGDKHFKSSTLLDVITSTEYGWWKFLSTSSSVNTNRIEFDKKLLKNFYLNEGFYNAQILSTDINLLNKNSASITYSINSGQKHKFSDIEIVDTEKNLNPDDYTIINGFAINGLKGDYSLKKINNIQEKIFTYLSQKKIEFVNFNILENPFQNNDISIKIVFKKTPRNFVNQINIMGNSITEEEVVRRELIFSEGDTFSTYKLNKSIDNLKASGIFKEIKASIKNLENEQVNIELDVEEQPTGSISAGVGIGTAGSQVTTGISEKNLFGKGINVNSNISLGTENIKGNISTTIPDFKNTDNALTYNVYAISTDFENAGYESSLIGNSLSIKYDLLENITLRPGISIERDKIDTNSSASQLYQDRKGNYTTFKTFYNLVTDKRDKRFQTTKGYRVNFGQKLATPGSDIPHLENNLSGAYYHSINTDYIITVKSGLNSINSLNDKDVKLSDRQFLSSRNLRGFENYGVGPKDGKDHIGGNYSAYTNIATTFPNPLPDKWNANSILFLDAGNVWGVDFDSSKDSNKLRSSAGLGLDWISPVGPLSFIFAQTLSSADGDLEESFSFQLGSSF